MASRGLDNNEPAYHRSFELAGGHEQVPHGHGPGLREAHTKKSGTKEFHARKHLRCFGSAGLC
ncbi:MAG: hypothetical protein MK103_14295, partial [Planctomycetes bacterium]|nr:hypothetical protein [Planctomycetota bacterium]